MILDRVLEGRRVVVCAGAGGVGKTTVAAALGSQLASRGGRVLVLTIDPARRLAGALGLPDHGDDVHAVDLGGDGHRPEGSLHAAMLDAQLTFDRLVREQARPRKPQSGSWRTASTGRCRERSPGPTSTWRWSASTSCTRAASTT